MTVRTAVLGGGTAGCVVASRLAEDPERGVSLVEAGPDYGTTENLPDDIRSAWVLASVEQRFEHFFPVRPSTDGVLVLRPRVLGGGSAVNATNAIRPQPADLDRWAELGNTEWSWQHCLPTFRAIEDDPRGGDVHGSCGPVPIRRLRHNQLHPLQAAFLEACTAEGIPATDDHNAVGAVGAGPAPMNQSPDGLRCSTAVAYLDGRSRANLQIQGGRTIDRLLLDGARVTSAVFDDGTTLEADEFVLCAGAYGTPQILLRSGIGPRRHLDEVAIPTVLDLPGVGSSLRDQPAGAVVATLAPHAPGPDGPPAQTIAVVASDGRHEPGRVDLHLAPMVLPGALVVGCALTNPTTFGSIRLSGPSLADDPVITLNLFAEPDDRRRLRAGIRLARRLLQHDDLARCLDAEVFPGPSVVDDDDLDSALSSAGGAYHHGNGTCPMGPDPARGHVVDQTGRVHGVENLRIADASIFPAQPAAPTNLLVVAVAERVAAFIRRAPAHV